MGVAAARAGQMWAAVFAAFDLLIALAGENARDSEALRPAGNTTPLRRLTTDGPQPGADHVPDPYYTRDFDGALELIESCVAGLKIALER